jgi:hypothetical protein
MSIFEYERYVPLHLRRIMPNQATRGVVAPPRTPYSSITHSNSPAGEISSPSRQCQSFLSSHDSNVHSSAVQCSPNSHFSHHPSPTFPLSHPPHRYQRVFSPNKKQQHVMIRTTRHNIIATYASITPSAFPRPLHHTSRASMCLTLLPPPRTGRFQDHDPAG